MQRFSFFFLLLHGIFSLEGEKYVYRWVDTLDLENYDYGYGVAINDYYKSCVTGYTVLDTEIDILTAMYDSSGNILWLDTLNIGIDDYAFGVDFDDNGNAYVTGCSQFGGSDSTKDVITVKYDSVGSIIWTISFDYNNDYDCAREIDVHNTNSFCVVGETYNGLNNDFLVVKYDLSGNVIWMDTVDNGETDIAYGVAIDQWENVYVTGASTISGTSDFFTVKYNIYGWVRWKRSFDNGGNDYAYDAAVDGYGNVYVTGCSYINANFDFFTIKYDTSGSILWADTIDNGGNDIATSIGIDSSNNVYVAGYSFIGYNYDYFIVKYDPNGNVVWMDTVDNGGTEYAYDLDVTKSGEPVLTGYTYVSYDYSFLTVDYEKFRDAGLVKIYSSDTVSTNEIYIPEVVMKNLSYELTLDLSVCCYIESSNVNIYADTQSVSGLNATDSVIVSFSSWTSPSESLDLDLRFMIIEDDMNSVNDSISGQLLVRENAGVEKKYERLSPSIDVELFNRGEVECKFLILNREKYHVYIASVDGRIVGDVSGEGMGWQCVRFTDIPPGIYFLNLKQNEFSESRRIVVF